MEFLQIMVREIVQYPDEIKIIRSVDEMGVLLTLTVSRPDMGRILGKQGTTAKAMRHMLAVWGMQRDQRLFLKIVDPVEHYGEQSNDDFG